MDEYCYLGITVHFSWNFKRAQKILCNKAVRAYNNLLKKISNFENVPIKILLYKTIWGPYMFRKTKSYESFKSNFFKNIKEIERIQLGFYKIILGVHSKTTNLAVYAELGKFPLISQVSTFVAKYWLRICSTHLNNTLIGEARNLCLGTNQTGFSLNTL